ncbi:universal stress protein [Massilia sp. DD77]|uniref:universal stress protein n=1 Tax=Massilia sp. DD77 TaxID=3109349 RepID=UPI002FFF7F5D
MYKRILFPTDGSEASGRAAYAALDFAKSTGATVVAMTAVPEFHTFTTDAEMLEQTASEYKEASTARAGRLLDEIAALARERGVPCTCLQVVSDSPYEAIIASAREQGCDLIMMASHGRRGIKGLLLGSETHKVLVHSAIPVMVHR